MPNEDIKVGVEDEIVELPETVEGEDDLTDYKALAAKNAGIAQRYKTKFEKSQIAKQVEKGVEKELEKKIEDLGLAEVAYLNSRGIPEDDHLIVLEAMKATGKGLRDTINSKYVQKELEEAKEARAAKTAIPEGTRRSGAPARDEMDYHYKKYEQSGWKELPEDRALRAKVINQRYEKESNVNMFPDNPITS